MDSDNNSNRFRQGTSQLNVDVNVNSNSANSSFDLTNILSDIIPTIEKQPKAKAVNFYLSMEVINAIDAISASSNVSKSKLVDTILRRVLCNK